MKVIRLRSGVCHLAYDEHQTYCGRQLVYLAAAEEFYADKVPLQTCRMCEATLRDEVLPTAPRVVLPVSHGYLRKAGPLTHGTRPQHRRGQKL